MIKASDNHRIELVLRDGIRVTASDDPTSPVLTRFFAGYDRCFILPDEREDMAGFEACLALNATHRNAYGRTHAELVVIFEDREGRLLGGANFLATAIAREENQPTSSIALNYVYVEEAARGRGLLRVILATVQDLGLIALGLDGKMPVPAIFIEQNDPLRLTAKEYAADTAHSGTDQIDRLAIWARMGARVVDFAYVQPALSPDHQPDDGLIYAAVNFPHDEISAGFLHDHLESYFGISVLKGQGENLRGIAAYQVAALSTRQDHVKLLAMEPALAWLRSGKKTRDFDSFRALAEAINREG